MSNSTLVDYTLISPNKSSPRNNSIDTISIHCVVGQCSIESLGNIFAPTTRQASSNYGIGSDGRIGMYVEEKDRSWCTSSAENDHRAITIECASDTTDPYAINDAVYKSLIILCADICKRNNIDSLKWQADKTLIGDIDKQNLTVHRWFANKSCPGDYIYNRLGQIASEVNALLQSNETDTSQTDEQETLYRVQTGAFSNKANADSMLETLEAKGYDTYLVLANNLYKIQVGAFSVLDNANSMAQKLELDGFDTYITTESGETVSSVSLKSIYEIALEVIKGLWGNGQDRVNRLTAAGYDYSTVQKKVNELL